MVGWRDGWLCGWMAASMGGAGSGEQNKCKTLAARELRICFCLAPTNGRAIKLCQFVLPPFGYGSIDKHAIATARSVTI